MARQEAPRGRCHSRRSRCCLPRSDQAPLSSLLRISRVHGLGDAARPIPTVRRRAAGSAPAPRYLASAALLAALRARQRGADAAVDRLALTLLPLCPFPDQVESV